MQIGKSRLTGCRGFTYLWLLFVVALGGVALASLGQRQQTVQQREREAELRFRGEAIAKAIAAYMQASPVGTNTLPQRLEDLLEDRRSGRAQHHLRRLYVDPFTGRADWQLILGQAAVKKEKPDQEDGSGEAAQVKTKPTVPGNKFGGAAAASEAQGQPLYSGIVGVNSRSQALLLTTGKLAGADAVSSAGVVGPADGSPAKAQKTRKPKVSELQFIAPTEVLASE